MQLPTSLPESDPSNLWAMQNTLLMMAENLVGARDKTKNIYQPTFHENGPQIRNTPSFDGAFVELGNGSKADWPTVVFEMAHETIHLLNPIAGYTNWLEEGVAVEFSIYAQNKYELFPIQQPTVGSYFEALQMVRMLLGGSFPAAHRIRAKAGSLGAVTFEQLQDLFPECEATLLRRLSEECKPR
jgi:hypothetical protein